MKVYFTEQGLKVKLSSKWISEGGEGLIYKLEPTSEIPGPAHLLATIYRPGKAVSEQKLLALKNIFKDKDVTGIACPKELLYDKKKQCVGFLMPNYIGDCLYDIVFSPTTLRELEWSRIELAELADKILDRFVALHSNGVLMADVNHFNILILKNTRTPVFVDVDSYQVNDKFPCMVRTLEYASPRILDMNTDEGVYRNEEDEYYAIAVLLFMIFLVGKNPYARNGVGSLEKNLRSRDFVFPNGYDDNTNMPKGPWQRIWYNLSYDLRNAFYSAFSEDRYLTPVEWKGIIHEYMNGLRDGSYPKVVFPKDNIQSLQKSILKLPTLPFSSEEEDLRKFDNVLDISADPLTEFLEFGTTSIRGFRNENYRSHTLPIPYLNCVKNDCEMDLQMLEKALTNISLAEWLSDDPPVTHLHAFGGALWRNLTNRKAVVEKIRETTGINLGIMTLDEEAAVLIDACQEYSDQSELTVAVDISGVSMFVASKEGDDLSCWEYGDLGSKILSNWMFATSHIDTRLLTKLDDHDQSVAAKLIDMRLAGSCTRLFGFGIIRELAAKRNRQPGQLQTFTLSQLRYQRDELTRELVTNRTNVMVLYEDLDYDFKGRLARKLELRLTLSVYISLMENLHVDELVILPFNAGRAYVNYYSKIQQK